MSDLQLQKTIVLHLLTKLMSMQAQYKIFFGLIHNTRVLYDITAKRYSSV